MEPSPWMGHPENISGIQKFQFSLTKKQKKQMEPSSWMGPPENMSGIQKLQFSLTKNLKKSKKNKIKTKKSFSMLSGGPIQGLGYIFLFLFCFVLFFLFIFCFLFFHLGLFWIFFFDLFFWFLCFLFFF